MPKVNITVKQLNLIIHRQYNLSSQDCGICRNPLVAPTPQKLVKHDASVKEIDLTCTPVLGKCGDAFHKSCIDSLIVNGSCVCPVCRNPWAFNKNLDSCVTYGAMTDKSIKTVKATPLVHSVKPLQKHKVEGDEKPVLKPILTGQSILIGPHSIMIGQAPVA
jgi:hypothetical protein